MLFLLLISKNLLENLSIKIINKSSIVPSISIKFLVLDFIKKIKNSLK